MKIEYLYSYTGHHSGRLYLWADVYTSGLVLVGTDLWYALDWAASYVGISSEGLVPS